MHYEEEMRNIFMEYGTRRSVPKGEIYRSTAEGHRPIALLVQVKIPKPRTLNPPLDCRGAQANCASLFQAYGDASIYGCWMYAWRRNLSQACILHS